MKSQSEAIGCLEPYLFIFVALLASPFWLIGSLKGGTVVPKATVELLSG